mgnify:FL=1
MRTTIKFLLGSATDLSMLADNTIDLVVTSPPYPMIRMWDDVFIRMDSRIRSALEAHEGPSVFECMHQILDVVWEEVFRVLNLEGSSVSISVMRHGRYMANTGCIRTIPVI